MEVVKAKRPKFLIVTGSLLLLIMGGFHASGFFYVSDAINESNSEEFLKDIVPALFAHPSIHLIGLAAFGLLMLSFKEAKKVLLLLSILVLLDAGLAIYLGGALPGILLTIAALCYFGASIKPKP